MPLRKGVCDDIYTLVRMEGEGSVRLETFSEQEVDRDAIRDRVKEWSRLGLAQVLHRLVLAAYERTIGLDLDDLSADGCITKAPCNGETAGPLPVDRRKEGMKRSVATDGDGVPVGLAAAGANRHDSKLLEPTLESVNDRVGSVLRPFLDERVRRTPALLPAHDRDRRVLPLPRRRVRHCALFDPAGPQPLPMGHPSRSLPPETTPTLGRSKAHIPSPERSSGQVTALQWS